MLKELLLGILLLGIGIAITMLNDFSGGLGVNIIKSGTVLWAAGLACMIDAVARPDAPVSRVLVGLLCLAFAVGW